MDFFELNNDNSGEDLNRPITLNYDIPTSYK